MNNQSRIYKIVFHNQDRIYELYARHVGPCDMLGFIEVSDFVFGNHSGVLLDPSEEKLKAEFEGVGASYIPQQAVIRIDKVSRGGTNKIISADTNVSPFPSKPSPIKG